MAATIEEKLGSLKQNFDKFENDIAETTKARNALKEEIANLEKLVGEKKQIVDAYAKVFTTVRNEVSAIATDYNNNTMLVSAVEENKDGVIEKIDEVDSGIEAIRKECEELRTAMEEARALYDAAKLSRDGELKSYALIKNRQKEIEEKLKRLKDLKTLIGKEESSNRFPKMYFYSLQFQDLLGNMTKLLQEPDAFGVSLADAWTKVDSAETEFKTLESAFEKARLACNEKEKELNEARDKWEANILKSLGA